MKSTPKKWVEYLHGMTQSEASLRLALLTELIMEKLEALYEKMKSKEQECFKANHLLTMAYANHRQGESYAECDRQTDIAWTLRNEYVALHDEYSRLCDEINISL